MIKGFSLNLTLNTKTLIWHAVKPTTVTVRSCSSGARVGDTNVTVNNGFKLLSQEVSSFSLATNDDLYIISSSDCRISVMAQSP